MDLYQDSLKARDEKVKVNNGIVEINFIVLIDAPNLDVLDFFANPDGKIDHLICGGVLR